MTKDDTPALTMEDIKTLEAMFIVSAHELNVLVNTIELGLFGIYKESKDYKRLTKLYGKTNADEIVKATVRDQISHDQAYQIGNILQAVRKLKYQLDQLTGAGIAIDPDKLDPSLSPADRAKQKAQKEAEMFEALMNDAHLFAYRHALMCNISSEDDIKLDSTLKLLAKEHRVSDAILQRFKRK